jgi:hypothetical protein
LDHEQDQVAVTALGELDRLVESYLDLRWHFDPVEASAAGLSEHDDRLGSFLDSDIDEHLAALRSIMGAIESADVDGLPDEIDRTALLNEARCTVNRFTVERPHERNPSLWLSHVLEGLYHLLAVKDRSHEHCARAAASRMRGIPGFLERATDTLGPCSRIHLGLSQQIVAGGKALIDEISTSLRPADDAEHAQTCADAHAALDAFAEHLGGTLMDTATDDVGIGEDAFNFRLHFQHALRMTAPEVLRFGVRLLDEVEQDLESVAAEISPGVPWPDLMDRLRDDHPAASDLVDAYASEMERARLFVAERGLAPIPEGTLDVIATPSFLRPLVPFAAYQPPGAYSADRTGWFYVTPPGGDDAAQRDQALRDHCTHEIPSTALHEGYPGHHLQFLCAQGQPRLVRRLVSTPVTVEGWALYCEEMMGEEGFYRSPEERFFQRVALLWRAVRVVLDVGLHTGSITYDKAVSMLQERVHFPRSLAESEAKRYCVEPAYQLAYAVGRHEIRSLRDQYRQAAGGEYSLRHFHEEVLSYGGLPVSLIRWGLGLDA